MWRKKTILMIDKLFFTAIVDKFHNFDKDDNDKNLCFGS